MVTTALGFTPYNATNPAGYITSAALGSYLPLSGGTIAGQLNVNNAGSATTVMRLWSAGSSIWSLGVGDSSGTNFNISSDFGSFLINKSSGNVTTSGQYYAGSSNLVLHLGNKDNYTYPPASHDHSRIGWTGTRTAESGTTNSTPSGFFEMVGAYNNGWPATYGNVLSANGGGAGQLYMGWIGGSGAETGELYYRSMTDWRTNWGSWRRIITDANYNSYSPTLTGGGASGTWGINITGNAATATSATDSTKLPLTGGTMTGQITLVPGTPWQVLAPGSGTYNRHVQYITGTEYTLEAAFATDSLSGSKLPITFTWRGGYGATGGLQLTGGAGGTLGGNTILHAGNYTSYANAKGGGWYGSGLPGTRWGGYSASGGEISFGDGLPNANQMGILVDGCYVAGENNGFWSLGSDNSWGSRRGMYWDGSYLNFTTNSATAYFTNALIGGNQIFHVGNYTSYNGIIRALGYPSGGNNWDALGNDYHNSVIQVDPSNFSSTANGPTAASYQYGTLLNLASNSSSKSQIYISHAGNDLIFRGGWGTGSWQTWNKVLTNQNYNSYSPTLTGGNASGTWGINVTGTASSISGFNNPTTAATANTIAYRDAAGDLTVRELVMNVAVQNFTPSSLVAIYPTTNQAVKVNATGARAFLDVPTRTGGDASGTWGIAISGNAATASKTTANAGYARVGYGMAPFYNWGGANAGAGAPSDSTYTTGIDVGSHPGDQAYGFQIASNMWNVGLWTRTYNSGFSGWVRLLDSSNYSSYALPLSGGTLSGALALSDSRLYLRTNGDTNHYLWNADDDWEEMVAYSGTGFRVKSSTGTTLATFTTGAVNAGVALQQGGNQVLHAGNYTSYAAAASHTQSVTTLSDRPDWFSGGSFIASHNNANEWRNSGFYENGGGGSNWPSATWYNSINVRHSNTGNYHGFQLAMSYYDNNLWFRSYQGSGTFQSWAVALSSQNYSSYALPLSGGTMSGNISFANDSAAGIFNAAGNAGYRPDDQWGNTYMFNQAGAGGWYGDFSGYYFRSSSASNWLTISGSAVNSSVALQQSGNQILHAGNYTSYTVNRGGDTLSGLWYFLSNRNTTSDSCPLQAFSNNGSGATMSFHRGGYYAVNFGLDSDNVMRIGGWSAAANRWQLDMSGNGTYAGNVTAYSDERLKKDWTPVQTDFITELAKVKSGTYTRIDSEQRQAGVSAQDFQKLLPETVSEDNAGTLSLAYGNAALVSAVELAKEVIDLRAQVTELRALIITLINKDLS
jgi:hypothetical protein